MLWSRRQGVPKGAISYESGLDAGGLRFALVVARFNPGITEQLYEGCRAELTERGAQETDLTVVEVPGCFELPLASKELAASGRFDGIICLGAVIRGDTPHFEYVSSATALGIQQAALETRVPVVFGVLTTDNKRQALDRVGGSDGHKGREAALTAIEMARTMRGLRERLGAADVGTR
jgi:6,7-dimethyl-8-ribityllumazine synthase